MKKPVTKSNRMKPGAMKAVNIVLAVAAAAAIIVSCVFGVQRAGLRRTVEELQTRLAETEAKLDETESARAELERRMTEAAAASESELTDTRTELARASENAAAAETENAALAGQVAGLETAQAELETALADREARLEKAERALNAVRSNACLVYASGDWSVTNWGTADSEDGNIRVTPASVIGEGEYTVGLEFAEETAGMSLCAVSIDGGETAFPGCFIRLNAVRVNGRSIAFGNGYTLSEDGQTTRLYLYREWSGEEAATARCYDGSTAEASSLIVDRDAFEKVKTVEVDFSVLTAPIDQAYIMFSNSDGSVQNWSPEGNRSAGVTSEAAEIRGSGSGYRVALNFEKPVKDLSLLALGVRRGEITFPGYALMITRIWVNGEKIDGLDGLKGYTSSDNGIETRMNLYNEGVGEIPGDARSLSGTLEGASAVWVDKAAFEGAERIEIEFGYRPVPVTGE